MTNRIRSARRRRHFSRHQLPARGMSVLLVLSILSMTLALAYAMTRLNYSMEQNQTNYQRTAESRQAALTGLTTALNRLKQANWAGVDVPITGSLGSGMSYSATFTTGDSSLTPGDADYWQYPYRLTVTSTGTAVDTSNAAVSSTHRMQAVVQFVPRKMVDPPTTWNGLQNYTIYQWSTSSGETLRLNPPVRIEGPVLSQNSVSLGGDNIGDGDSYPFAGQIDEVAVFGKALSASQIENVYEGGGGGIFVGTGHRLIARWRFDEAAGSVVAHDTKDTYDALYDGARAGGTPAPIFGGTGSVILDGFNDHVHLGTVDAPGGELTILAWIKPSSFPNDAGRIIAKASSGDTDDQYWTVSHYLTNGRRALRFRLKTGSGTSTLSASNINLVAGQWSFIAAVYTGSEMQLYHNGQLASEMSKYGSIPSAPSVLASVGNSPPASPRAKYFRDIQKMFQQAGTDYRMLTQPITASVSRTTAAERSLITDEMQNTWNDLPATSAAPLTHPGSVLSYRLYPGGQSYAVPTLGSTLRNQSLGPDVELNPLGIFYRSGNLDVRENVSITGTVIVNGSDSTPDIEVYGSNISFNSVAIPPVEGSTLSPKLPIAIVKDDFRFFSGTQATVNGAAVTWGEFGFPLGSDSTRITFAGRAIVNKFYCDQRFDWWRTDDWWRDRLREFYLQLTGSNPVLYFPQWLKANHDFDPQPKIVLRPPQANEVYHWHTWSQPIFVAHPNDGGLRWELLEVRELR